MAPLPPGADATPLERAQWDRAQAELKADLRDAGDSNAQLEARYEATFNRPDFRPMPWEEARDLLLTLQPGDRMIDATGTRSRPVVKIEPVLETKNGGTVYGIWLEGATQPTRLREYIRMMSEGELAIERQQDGPTPSQQDLARKESSDKILAQLMGNGIELTAEDLRKAGILKASLRQAFPNVPLPTAQEIRQILAAAPRLQVSPSPSLPISSTPSQALVIYRRLTAERDRLAQAGRNLTPDQAQRLEQAERQLGQVMMDFLPPPSTPDLRLESEPTRTRDLARTPTTEQLRLFASARITESPFSTPESKALEDTRIHAIDVLLHGKRRPIAETAPADLARSSRAQLPALLAHLRRGQRASGSFAGNEQAGTAETRQRDKALLIDWARNAGVLINAIPGRYQLDGPKDKGGREHHVFHDPSGRWLKITKGDGEAFGLQPLDEGGKNEWMLSPERADAASYLEKLILHNQVFHDDIVLHGVVADPLGKVALIISQPDYQGTFADVYTSIQPAMENAGFVRVEPPSARLEDPSAYYRPSDNLAVIDLHDQNAVLEGNGTFLRVFDNIMLHPTGALRATFERLAAKNAKPALPAAARLEAARRQTNTAPTQPQIDAENYQTGKVSIQGLRLSIENPRGSVRSGTDANGKSWEVTMPHDYGRILGTKGADKDHVDFFMGPDPDSPTAFVINQRKPGNGHFDEHKVRPPHTPSPRHAHSQLDPAPSKAIS